MPSSSLLIVSKYDDFSAVLAEHVTQELGLVVTITDTPEKAKKIETQLIIAHEPLSGAFSAPVLVVDQKPIRLQDVLEKIQQQLAKEELPLAGGALFSVQQKTITNGKKIISLTDKETQLLLALLKNKNGVEKDALLKNVWGVETELESHTLETHIYRLRAKLKDAGVSATISAAPGKYMLEA